MLHQCPIIQHFISEATMAGPIVESSRSPIATSPIAHMNTVTRSQRTRPPLLRRLPSFTRLAHKSVGTFLTLGLLGACLFFLLTSLLDSVPYTATLSHSQTSERDALQQDGRIAERTIADSFPQLSGQNPANSEHNAANSYRNKVELRVRLVDAGREAQNESTQPTGFESRTEHDTLLHSEFNSRPQLADLLSEWWNAREELETLHSTNSGGSESQMMADLSTPAGGGGDIAQKGNVKSGGSNSPVGPGSRYTYPSTPAAERANAVVAVLVRNRELKGLLKVCARHWCAF